MRHHRPAGGESAFRALEAAALEALADAEPSVVACGGGVILDASNRVLLKRTGTIVLASAAGDANAEHDIYDDDAICDYPQSGERILGRSNLQALRSHHPGKPSGFKVKRILGNRIIKIDPRGLTPSAPTHAFKILCAVLAFRNNR